MIRAALVALTALALGAVAPAEAAGPATVYIQFAAFGPSQIDVLPGETVAWSNVSDRRHTVNADDGSFASGDINGGDTFTHPFAGVGAFPYHCTVHPGMSGEIDVRPLTLDPLPVAPIPAGDKVEFAGRTADPRDQIRVERIDAAGPTTIARATPAPDGSWSTSVPATRSGDYRAVNGHGAANTRHLLVSDRKVLVRATRKGIAVTVRPALPYGRVVLQQKLPERFGWWTVTSVRLDYVSEAIIPVARSARTRVALVDKDGWTALATSRVVRPRRPVVRHRMRSH